MSDVVGHNHEGGRRAPALTRVAETSLVSEDMKQEQGSLLFTSSLDQRDMQGSNKKD